MFHKSLKTLKSSLNRPPKIAPRSLPTPPKNRPSPRKATPSTAPMRINQGSRYFQKTTIRITRVSIPRVLPIRTTIPLRELRKLIKSLMIPSVISPAEGSVGYPLGFPSFLLLPSTTEPRLSTGSHSTGTVCFSPLAFWKVKEKMSTSLWITFS